MSGELRARHRVVLAAVSRGEVRRCPDYHYRLAGTPRARHCSEAVYMLEEQGLLTLTRAGDITITVSGLEWLSKHGVPAGATRLLLSPGIFTTTQAA